MVKKTGINMGAVKINNRASILKLLKNNGAMSRKDIANILQLTPAAITILTNEMKEENILIERGELEEDKRVGRKKILIDIDYDYKYVIGINMGFDCINLGIANLKGEIIISKSINTDRSIKPKEILKRVSNESIGVLWKAGVLKEKVLGVGVGIVGHVDEVDGISKGVYGLWKEEVQIKKILEEELGLKVVVDNNVRALALGEIDYGNSSDLQNILFIKYGPGIGSAIIINKEIHYGSSNRAGEIGHSIMDSNGRLCRCGKRGCLEAVASPSAIITSAEEIFSQDNTPKLYKKCNGNISNVHISNILESAEEGDEAVIELIKRAAHFMGLAVINAMGIIDPKKVIFYGGAFENKAFYGEFIKFMEKVSMEKDVEKIIGLSKLKNRSNYIGGVALAIRQFFFNIGGVF